MPTHHDMIAALQKAGVQLIAPQTVTLGNDLDPSRFAVGVTIHPGCRLAGADTSLGPDCAVGAEGPATLIDVQMGARVAFKSGFAQQATLMDDVDVGSNAHLRPGTLLEEHASVAHCVGLKQTILLPFVTLGSLINFCDCLMAGGTGLDNHSEVGSGFVHFNFTARQDKATPSLIGDVPHGVLLNQPPIFLGGQGGLVGPRRIAYGSVLAAGQICRRDIMQPGNLVMESGPSSRIEKPYDPRTFHSLQTILENNRCYIGNLLALACWYRAIRLPWATSQPTWRMALVQGALKRLDEAFGERLKRLAQLASKAAEALATGNSDARKRLMSPKPTDLLKRFSESWPSQQQALVAYRNRMLDMPAALPQPTPGAGYLQWVRALQASDHHRITHHLQTLIDNTPCYET